MKQLSSFLAAVLLIMASVAHATDFSSPDQKIIGADSPIPLGELVDLSISTVKDKPKFYVSSSYDWKVIDLSNGKEKRFRSYDNGVCFGAGIKNKRMLVLCAVTHVFIVKDSTNKVTEVGTRTLFISSEVTIGDGAQPDPPPGPAPPSPFVPSPSLPDGKFKLSSTVFGLSGAVSDANSRVHGAQVLARSFRGIASSIAAGALKDPADILQKTTASNISAMATAGVPRADWEPFFRQLMDAVYGLYESGKLTTANDFSAAWNEIAIGLEAVK